MSKLFFLCPLLFLAGFIDSIAGGGGLISLTSYIACGLSGTLALGTNKFSSILGSTVASANYLKTGNVEPKALITAVPGAIIGSFLGSQLSLKIDSYAFSIMLLIVTPIVLILVLLDKNYAGHEKDRSTAGVLLLALVISVAVGFYDGFYGPGTGTFLQMGFIVIVGLNLKKACGDARIVNWASNLAAVFNFVRTGNVLYSIAIPCAICSVFGNYIGSKLAIKKDVKIIKPMMLCVVALLFLKVLFDLLK